MQTARGPIATGSIVIVLNHRAAAASASDGAGDLVVGLLVPVVLILLELIGDGGGDGFLRVLHHVDDSVENVLRHAQGLGQLPGLTGNHIAGVGQHSVLDGRLRNAQGKAGSGIFYFSNFFILFLFFIINVYKNEKFLSCNL